MIMTIFCPLSVSSEAGDVKWTQQCPNSAGTHRPLALQLGKESSETLRSLTVFEDDIEKSKTEGHSIDVNNHSINMKINIISHMMDLKAAHLYLGLGGSFSDVCEFSKSECHDPDIVKQGFNITRNITDTQALFDSLSGESGTVKKSKDDYHTRKGLTTKPIAQHDVTSIQVLHALLRSFDHFMKIIVHLRAGVLNWSEAVEDEALKRAKKQIQEEIQKEMGEKWDYPDKTGKGGTTTTGNTARRILHCGQREVVVRMVPECYQPAVRRVGQYLSVILRLFSSDLLINITAYKNICTNLYLLFLQCFPSSDHSTSWINITPSVHKLLGHSWEMIENNGDHGLRCLDEAGFEANNKVLRSVRMKLARKTSQEDNLTDVINRMWLLSDPKVKDVKKLTDPYCKHCNVYDHSTVVLNILHLVL